jgi:hypothetical protein
MPDDRRLPVSTTLFNAIQAAVERETGRSPLVGTGHVKWPPVAMPPGRGDAADELRVDRLVVTLDFERHE